MKKVFYLITVLALGLTACDKNEIQPPGEVAAEGFYVIRGPRMEHYDAENKITWYTWDFEVSAE